MCRLVVIYLLASLIGFAATAQRHHLKFERISVEDGLSQATVTSILQDRRGFMWFGTEEGLNKYDGYSFTVYKHKRRDTSGLSNSSIWAMHEDREGDLWLGITNGIARYNPYQDNFQNYLLSQESVENEDFVVGAIHEDESFLWLGTSGRGLLRFDKRSKTFEIYFNKIGDHQAMNFAKNYIICIHGLDKDRLLLATRGLGLVEFDKKSGKFVDFHVLDSFYNRNVVWDIYGENGEELWLATLNGLAHLNLINDKFTIYRHDPEEPYSLGHNNVAEIEKAGDNGLWLATYGGGLNYFDRGQKRFYTYRSDPENQETIGSDLLLSLLTDNSGNLWIGSVGSGISKLRGTSSRFQHYSVRDGLTNKLIRGIAASQGENGEWIWIGSYGGGLSKGILKKQEGENYSMVFQPFSTFVTDDLHTPLVNCIFQGRERLWIGTDGQGVAYLETNPQNLKDGDFTYYYFKAFGDRSHTLSNNLISALYEDPNGDLWVGTNGSGLNKIVSGKNYGTEGSVIYYLHEPGNPTSLSNNLVTAIFCDKQERLWVGTSNGLNLFQKGKFVRFSEEDNENGGLSHNNITFIHEDRKQNLWIGTQGGLNVKKWDQDRFQHYTVQDGLPSDIVTGMLEDDKGNFWISTHKGISLFDPVEGSFRNFFKMDGLQGNEFNPGALWKSSTGYFLFGGINGISAFDPKKIVINTTPPPVAITNFKVFNKEVPVKSHVSRDYDGFFIPRSISTSDQITLSYKENIFTLGFASLDFTLSPKSQYAYQLDGFDKDWVYVDASRRFATYTNLDPGDYIFNVKGTNNDGTWSEPTKLALTITPPPWRTWWAYCIYGAAILALLLWSRQQIINRERLKTKWQLDHLELEKMQELDKIKSRFFANISHEFRTPLTLIIGPLKKLLDGRIQDADKTGNLKLMYKNADRLNRLIDQLLDLSKLEARKLQVQKEQGELIRFLRSTVSSFDSLAHQNKILFKKKIPAEACYASFDPDKLEKIIYNLLSNAFKFTPEQGIVEIEISLTDPAPESELSITVKDTGIGLEKEELGKIFDRFYRTTHSEQNETEGTGIGLALTKELAELMKGSVTVDSQKGKGTTFQVTLPIEVIEKKPVVPGSGDGEPQKNDFGSPYSKDEDTVSESLPIVLVTEDNVDLRYYIKDCLGNSYSFLEAANGKEGFEIAREKIPDVIISDLMMPVMDGLKFCQSIKTDNRTSHIPFIMLTAKAADENRVEGLETGADDYITKPFDAKSLSLKVKNIILQRNRLQEKLRKELTLELPEKEVPSHQEQFIGKMKSVVERYMEDPELNVEFLCEELAMSRVQLYRKTLAITGLTPSEFIRTIRLKKASQLLKQQWGTVSETSYAVGFNNLSYFAKCFREMFGQTPSEFLAAHTKA